MPRSAVSTHAKHTQPRSTLRANARFTSTYQSIEKSNVDDVENDEEFVGDGDAGDGDDDGTAEMFALLKEIQKRKSAKTSTRSTAFQTKKNALYADARKNANTIVQDGLAYLESLRTTVAEIKAQELSQEKRLSDLALLWKTNDDIIRSLLATCTPVISDLSHRRASHTNDTSAVLEAHSAERQVSRRRLMKNATVRMEENLENQKIATDANALIKHYTDILLS